MVAFFKRLKSYKGESFGEDCGKHAQRDQILSAFMMGGKLAIEIVAVDHWAIVNLADETGLTTCDASYLWLADHLKGELITLDEKMQRAAKSL